MANYVGIDLGTTNSVISTYDGANTRIRQSLRERNDVTPSAIFIGRRGNTIVGQGAYNQVGRFPDKCATEFKREMGTSTPIELAGANRTFTPEECSAEILKTLFGYLPEEIRNSPDTGTVVTVPAAFNQIKKNATSQAAEMAGIGNFKLMQEPVAAVMSYMRVRNTDGRFLVYDLGGGTFDAAIAESTGGRVSLLAHGGIEFCGGRDFDRLLRDNIVLAHLHKKYNLPDNLSADPTFRKILRPIELGCEAAKIGLSTEDEYAIIVGDIDEDEPLLDLNGAEIYEDIPLHRDTFDRLIAEKINDTINRARETMEECGVNAQDLDCIVWVGGPTHYKPLRDKVSSELGIEGDLDAVNPMTTVAEGASIFAESIDWSSEDRGRKSTRGQISDAELPFRFNYIARTSTDTAKIAVQVDGNVSTGNTFEVVSLDNASISGRYPLKHATTVDVFLPKPGDNTFKVTVYDAAGEPIKQEEIVITKTAAILDAIPASHTIVLEVLDRLGGQPKPYHLIEKGAPLPQEKRSVELIAGQTVIAGSSDSLKFILWEGDIKHPIKDNRFIGCLEVTGRDFDDGIISEGSDIICNYEILDSGEIILEVETREISGIYKENFYSRKKAERDYSADASQIANEATQVRNRVDEIANNIDDPRLEDARRKLELPSSLNSEESDTEKVQEASEAILDANNLINRVKKDNLKVIRQMDIDDTLTFFDTYIRQHARPSEATEYDNLVATAQRSIDNNDSDEVFESLLSQLRGRNFEILWRQPWFVIEQFKHLESTPYAFLDQRRFEELARSGRQFIEREGLDRELHQGPIIDTPAIGDLREIVRELMLLPRIGGEQGVDNIDQVANILLKNSPQN